MKKITLLFALFLGVISSCYAQITIEFLSHPNEFTVDAGNPAVFGPSVGQQPLVVRISNIPDATATTNAAPAPIRAASAVQTALGAVTIPASGDFTGLLSTAFNPGGTNFGYTNLHQVQVNNPTSVGPTLIKTDNGNGTFNAVLIHTRFTQAVNYVEGEDYIVVQRTFLASPEPGGLAVKSDGGSGYVIAPMKYIAASTIETEAELISKANATLSSVKFNSNKLTSFYPNPTNDVLNFGNDVQTNSYKVLSVTGALIKEVKATSRTLDVSDLKAGLYFIATDNAVAKFVKR
jgi:hypothetical protein